MCVFLMFLNLKVVVMVFLGMILVFVFVVMVGCCYWVSLVVILVIVLFGDNLWSWGVMCVVLWRMMWCYWMVLNL